VTIQIRDRILIDGEEHSITGISLDNASWPSVRKYIASVQSFSACWRGYYAKWKVESDRLVLVDLTIMWAGQAAYLTYQDVFPDLPQGVIADWFTGDIEVPQGQNLDLGHDFSMYEETLILSLKDGLVTGRLRRDNRDAAAARTLEIEQLYKPLPRVSTPVTGDEYPEEEETEIEKVCGEFMFAAMMGAVDDETREEWRFFYASAILHASPEEKSLLEIVGNAVEPKTRKP
jgi:hypothetical protein